MINFMSIVCLLYTLVTLLKGLLDLFYWNKLTWDIGPKGEPSEKDPYDGLVTICYEFILFDVIPLMGIFLMHHLNFSSQTIKMDMLTRKSI